MSHYDIAIIGLGPAGSTLARLLSPKFRVAALDKKIFGAESSGFRKPCGGLISGDAQKALASFDMTLPKDVLVDPQIFAVKTIDLKNKLIRHYQRFYINLDRHKFDLWLESIIPPAVEILRRFPRYIHRKRRTAHPDHKIHHRGRRRKLHCPPHILPAEKNTELSFHTAVVP